MTVRALVTNDDGIDSPGLRHLARAALDAGLDVTVAAPPVEASGSSAALTATQSEGRIIVESRTLDGISGVPAFAVAAAPAFIVLIAHRGAFGDPPEVILSGINRGANTGNAILHSGTVGATMTGASEGCRCLAVSLASGSPKHWETAQAMAGTVMREFVGMPPPLVLNLNVPDVEADEIRGLRRAHLAKFGAVQTTLAEVGHGYVKLGVAEERSEYEPGTDAALLAAGYATLTALNPLCERTDLDLSALEALRLNPVAARG